MRVSESLRPCPKVENTLTPSVALEGALTSILSFLGVSVDF